MAIFPPWQLSMLHLYVLFLLNVKMGLVKGPSQYVRMIPTQPELIFIFILAKIIFSLKYVDAQNSILATCSLVTSWMWVVLVLMGC